MDICADCLADISSRATRCIRCGIHVSHGAANPVCGKCTQHSPPYDITLAAFDYDNPVGQLIASLKFNGRTQLAVTLASAWLHHFVDTEIAIPQALIPVPLHRSRLQQRGYNQALEIARPVASSLGLPLITRDIVRNRATLPQTDLTARQRRQNIRGSFRVRLPQPYQHVAIFDDVVTTGSTAGELAKALKKTGIERVDVWCIARASR